jgi:hypothetical protein
MERITIKINRDIKEEINKIGGHSINDRLYNLLSKYKNQTQTTGGLGGHTGGQNVDIKPIIDKIHVCINDISVDTEQIKQDIDRIKDGLRQSGIKI